MRLSREMAAGERSRQIALGWITWPEVAIVGDMGDARTITIAAELRRLGVITATALSGTPKRQAKRFAESGAEYLLLVRTDGILLRDALTGEEQEVSAAAAPTIALDCLLYDWSITRVGSDA